MRGGRRGGRAGTPRPRPQNPGPDQARTQAQAMAGAPPGTQPPGDPAPTALDAHRPQALRGQETRDAEEAAGERQNPRKPRRGGGACPHAPLARCRHHSGYLADDEAGHTAHMARPPKKPLFPEMGPASKRGYVPHPPLLDSPGGNPRRHRPRGPQPFGNFLDFLTEGQVLDSLQTVVEEATERVAAMKTKGGVPLVEVQDPVEEPSRQRARVRPSLSTVHRHCVRPGLCTGHPNNYPSRSSSASDCRSSLSAGCPGDLGARGSGPLPPMRDRLLLEKNLKRLLKLERKGKGLSQSYSQRGSLPWDSLGSPASGQWTPEQPLSWFSGLLGSSSGSPEASELGPTERELIFLKRELNKEMQSWLSRPELFALPGYCALREPHLTLDFLAKHRLFPTLQQVVSQAVGKLSAARRRDGCPLFPMATATAAATTAVDADPLPDPELLDCPPKRNPAREEPYEPLPTTTSSPKTAERRSTKTKGRGKFKEGGSTIADTQVATRFRLKSPHFRFLRKKQLPSISSKSEASHPSDPWYKELVDYLIEQAVSLLIYKYKFEKNLSRQLGFISFPVTEALMDLLLGFKKVKGSHISLSSQIDWTCLLRKLEEAEWARRNSQQHGLQRSTEPTSLLPEPTTETDRDEATETNITVDPESPDQQLLALQEPTDGGEEEDNSYDKERVGSVDPKLSVTSSTSLGSIPHKSKEAANIQDTETSDNLEDSYSLGDEGTSQGLPEATVESVSMASTEVGHGEPP
ncbi:coiled-coil domain-containing protein 116 [Choloepus didactylus]|uniref:coiled-coil domain-containing protein 116 n=1 Tax=Choloepus didactylus TaxID=27675 RepID=UPI00189FB5BE|nr:coiled-coil domain-containing protein 116 [Choloepus didactylus]